MSILSKSHVGADSRFPIIKSVVTGTFSRWKISGVMPECEVGFDERGFYVDLYPCSNTILTLHEENRFYYAKNYVDAYDVDGDRRRYNEYICLMKNRDKTLMCPYFRFRNIYGDLMLEGCQWFKSLDHIDRIHGNVILSDIVHPVEIPCDLIIDGVIKELRSRAFYREYTTEQYKSRKEYRGRF